MACQPTSWRRARDPNSTSSRPLCQGHGAGVLNLSIPLAANPIAHGLMQKHRLSFSANQTVGKGHGPFDAVISRKFEAITHRFSQVSAVASAFVLRQFFSPFSCVDLIDSLSAHTPLTLSKIKLLASLAGYPCEKGVVTSQGLPCSVKDLLKPPSSMLTMLPELPRGCRLDP